MNQNDNSKEKLTRKMINFEEKYAHNEPDFRRFIRLLQVSKMWLLSAAIIAVSVALLVDIVQKRVYVSESILSVTASKNKVLPVGSALSLGALDDFFPKVYSLMEEFKNKETCMSVIKEVAKTAPDLITGLAPSQICQSITIQPEFERMHIKVRVKTDNPKLSQVVANIAAQELVKVDQKRLSRKVVEVKKFLSKQEVELGKQLRDLENEKTQFQAESSIISVPQAERNIYDTLEKTEQDYIDLQVKLKSNESLLKETNKSLQETKKMLTEKSEAVNGLYLSQIQYRLNMLKYKKSMGRGTQKPEDEERVDKEIAEIVQVYKNVLDGKQNQDVRIFGDPLEYYKALQEAKTALEKDNQQLTNQLAVINKNMKKKNEDIKFLASNIQRLGEISREIDVTNDLYLVIKKRLQEIQIDEASAVSDLMLLRSAEVGIKEDTPFLKRSLFFVSIALFMCVAFLLFKDSFIPAVKDMADLIDMGIVPIGYIPIVPINPLSKMPLLIRDYPHSIEADSFRALRLRFNSVKNQLGPDKKSISILVTSPRPASGKSFIAVNLAYSLAKSGAKTLLIDLDLRRPAVKSYFETISFSKTFDNFLKDGKLQNCVTSVAPNLDTVVPENSFDNPAEKIEEINISSMLSQAQEKYEFVIVDMPPTLSVIDPLLVTSYVDFNLLVVEHRKTHKEDISNAVHHLTELRKIPVFGLINMVYPEMISADGGRYYKVMSSPRNKASA